MPRPLSAPSNLSTARLNLLRFVQHCPQAVAVVGRQFLLRISRATRQAIELLAYVFKPPLRCCYPMAVGPRRAMSDVLVKTSAVKSSFCRSL